MDANEEIPEEAIREMDKKEFRKKFASGWVEITKNESMVLIIDTLIESSPSREFTTGELSDKSGISERSINNHIGSLVDLGVVEKLEDRKPNRYSLNQKSPIIQKVRELDATVKRVKSGDLSKTLDRPMRRIDNKNPMWGTLRIDTSAIAASDKNNGSGDESGSRIREVDPSAAQLAQ